MRKIFFLFILIYANEFLFSQKNTKIQSIYDFDTTNSILRDNFNKREIKIFTEINHSHEAEKVGLNLIPSNVFIIGNPKVGTYIMQENIEMAINLPLKILVYEKDKKVWVIYQNISPIAKKYNIKKVTNTIRKIDNTMKNIIEISVKNKNNDQAN